jgi:hypothetical protein
VCRHPRHLRLCRLAQEQSLTEARSGDGSGPGQGAFAIRVGGRCREGTHGQGPG